MMFWCSPKLNAEPVTWNFSSKVICPLWPFPRLPLHPCNISCNVVYFEKACPHPYTDLYFIITHNDLSVLKVFSLGRHIGNAFGQLFQVYNTKPLSKLMERLVTHLVKTSTNAVSSQYCGIVIVWFPFILNLSMMNCKGLHKWFPACLTVKTSN